MKLINENYCLDTDAYSFVIKVKRKGKKGVHYEPIAWCGNLRQVKDFLMNREIKCNPELLGSIDKVIELSREIDGIIK